jgi:hypothetical protein
VNAAACQFAMPWFELFHVEVNIVAAGPLTRKLEEIDGI